MKKELSSYRSNPFRRIVILSSCLALLGAGINLLSDKSWRTAAAPPPQKASGGSISLWQEIDEKSLFVAGERVTIPAAYKTYRLDQGSLSLLLASAPKEFGRAIATAQTIITIPMPDGRLARFSIEDSPIMEPALAAVFPQIKTYRGQGIDDPAATTRFDVTPAGFHAIILSAGDTVYVDPYAKGDTANYISYYKRDYRKDGASFQCFFDEANKDLPATASQPVPSVANAGTLRTYRLALAATVEYTAAAGGTVPAAMARMTTTMNRVNGIYERDLSIRMVMVANNSNVVFVTEPDGYTNNNGFQMLSQNQTKLDMVIGNANYDIGHVFSTGGGGVANLFVPCVSGNKARGVTGLANPTGDVFDVDYVSHEMGHQFGARHTFNGTQGSCGGGGGSSASYEPGSGTTIMAYAGICFIQDLQLNSNDYFHVKSLEEIIAYITTGAGTCAAQSFNGNFQPNVNAGSDFTIPKGTPFALTATGSDPNGDALTYCWEEYDLGPSSPPDNDADGFARPLFRSYLPTSSASRTFPSLGYILNNANNPPQSYSCPNGANSCTTGEALPSITRTMSFQVTARDNRAGGGGVNTDTMLVNVTATSGPFVITQPDSGVSWEGGSLQTITWDVANTNAAPVNCSLVKISLSTDGGNTFPIVISPNTLNDGAETITVPGAATTQGRIKVEAVGNIFFDISNSNLTINAPCSFSATPTSQFFTAAGGTGSVTVSTSASCSWAAASNNSWIVLTSSGSGSGNEPVTFEVRENTAATSRQGSLTVAGETITIIQNAAGSNCGYTIAPGSASFSGGGGTGNLAVSTGAGCSWQAASQTQWITITAGSTGIGNGLVNYSVAANATGKSRKGSIIVAGKTFAVKQGG
jgi:hypothetical protein